ncbi:hypothetical protein [Xylanimonas protaetiae]|uniref:Uncharacterized protein n=1 Tax=Xylanimonas protaetiae TaxID=2509457 RepID=A0A4P6F6Q7_9MICO|nr:hypothetical protein [Xylanimonas protaetiae]QAY71442.1 hypothetical protein ET471_16555 [Xylanimonas protaetiae]
MSGPKGYGYTVESAEARNRRECAEARGRCATLRDRARQTALEVVALGGKRASLPTVGSADDRSALEATEARLRTLVANLGAERDQLRARRRAAAIADRLAGVGGFTLALAAARRADATPTQAPAVASHDDGAALAAIVGALATVEDDDARDRLEALAARTGQAVADGAPDAQVLLLRVSTEAAAALHAQREAHLVRSDAAEAELALGDADGPEAAAVRAALRSATTPADVARLRARVDEVVARRRSQADRAFVVEQTAEVLRQLGYEVDDGFVEAAAAGERTRVGRADLPDHALQLRFLPGQDRVLARTVALRDTDEETDAAAEEANCGRLEALQVRWAAVGVASTRDHEMPVGVVPMQHVEGQTVSRGTGRPAATTRTHERPSERGAQR